MTRVKSGVLVSAALRYANTTLIDCVLERLAAEVKMDQDAFIVSVCDSEARNPFDAL